MDCGSPLPQKQSVAQQLSAKSSFCPGVRDCPLEELLLGVHEDVLVACHDLHALSDLPDVGLGGGGDHRHGEVSSFPTMVEFTVSPEGIRPFLPLQVGLMVIALVLPE